MESDGRGGCVESDGRERWCGEGWTSTGLVSVVSGGWCGE